MTNNTLIRCNIDIDGDGKQCGFLAVPISTNQSAYGILTIPITVLKNGDGPTISFTGGVHGDEYEGPIVLMKLANLLQPEEITGRVIIIPCLNLPAVQVGQRCSPMDGLNLNRVFPGNAHGSVTEMIAHYITTELMPVSDVHLDLHSGGQSLEYLPSIFMHESRGDRERRRSYEAAVAFGAEITLISDDFPDPGRFLTAMFDQAGITNFAVELGGAGKVNPAVVRVAEYGVKNLIIHFGIMAGEITTPEMQSRKSSRIARVADVECYIMAPDDGLYEPFVELGDEIVKGQPIGQVHYPQHHDKPAWEVQAPRSGFLLCKRPMGRVKRGDNIAILAEDV